VSAQHTTIRVNRYLLSLASVPAPAGHVAVTSAEARSVLQRAATGSSVASGVYQLWLAHAAGSRAGNARTVSARDRAQALQWALRGLGKLRTLILWRAQLPAVAGELPEIYVPRQSVPEPIRQPETHWIQFDVQDQNGDPITSVPYTVKLGEQVVGAGKLDRFGTVFMDGIEPGSYRFVLGGSAEPPIDGDFLMLELLDTEGVPFAGARYRVLDSADKVHEGALDGSGRAMLEGLEPGTCKVSFPDFPNESWDLA
jgi:hypothetical protein